MSSAEQYSSYAVSLTGDSLPTIADRSLPHAWARPVHVALVPRIRDSLIDPLLTALPASLRGYGGRLVPRPNRHTRIIVTTARYGEIISTKEALFFQAKLLFKLAHRPSVFTLVSVPRDELVETLTRLEQVAAASDAELDQFWFPGMPATGLPILREEARRGGPIKAFARLLQVQVKSVWTGAVVGDPATGAIDGIYLFDLVGAYPFVTAPSVEQMVDDLVARLTTIVCTSEADHHERVATTVPRDVWERTTAPERMVEAAWELGRRGFLTAPIQLKDFGFRALGRAISSQYSEGCLAIYDPEFGFLLTTATGSARVVDKRYISRADIALVQEIKPDYSGVRIPRVEGRSFVKPSVEALELARIVFDAPRFARSRPTVPVSIVHLHMGIAAYNPAVVEYVALDPPFYACPVSCGTRELADGTARAFARSSVLSNGDESRRIAVLEQPTHGCMLVELGGGTIPPYQRIFTAIDRGDLVLSFAVPQGRVRWQPPDERGMICKVS